VRCKLGPSAFAAGMPEPSLSPMSPAGFDGPLRPLGEVEIKKVYQYPRSRSESPLPGHAGANRDRSEWDPTSSLPALDAQDTRTQVTRENGWYGSERRSAFACCKARFAIEDRVLEDSALICALAVLS
jgi:hypothetical protein